MDFYTYSYVESQANTGYLLSYGISFILLLALLAAGIYYLHHRFATRYRDLSIILILLILLLVGIRSDEYERTREYQQGNSDMAAFLKNVSKERNVPVEDIHVNRLRLQNGMLITLHGNVYQVTFLSGNDAYQLTPVYLLKQKIHIVDGKD